MAFPHPAVTLSLSAQDLGCCYSSHIHSGLPCFSVASGVSPLPSGSSASLTPNAVVGAYCCTKSSDGREFPEGLWDLYHQRYPKSKWTRLWASCFEVVLSRAGIAEPVAAAPCNMNNSVLSSFPRNTCPALFCPTHFHWEGLLGSDSERRGNVIPSSY